MGRFKKDWWTKEEEDLLRHHHPDYQAACRALPNRTIRGIRDRARFLGLPKPRHKWTGREQQIIKAEIGNGAKAVRLALSHLRPQQIQKRIQLMGLTQPLKIAEWGIQSLDAIRCRAKGRGMNWGDLDREAGSGCYFRKAQRSIVWQHIAAAAEYLGGHVEIAWSDD